MIAANPDLTRLRVLFLSWRDTGNPEGGGAERYLEHVATGLVAHGAEVTVLSAAYPGAPAVELRDGVRYVHRGSKLSVYVQGMRAVFRKEFGQFDVIVDVQNGLPFFSRVVTRKPVIVLVHHVHREQWPVVYPGLMGRVGWWIERWFAPRLYRLDQYVAVSRATRAELVLLGVTTPRIAVVHNGTDRQVPRHRVKSGRPSICVVSRLVPHKQIEHAIAATIQLREEIHDLQLTIVGSGWWEPELRRYAEEQGAGDSVVFTGHVDEHHKRAVYEESWVMALPSLKEGWGLVVGEAALAGTPTVAYRYAGGTRESIVDGYSGLLANDQQEFVAALRRVLTDENLRASLARGAEDVSGRYTWQHAQETFAHVVNAAHRGELVAAQDEVADAGRDQPLAP